VTGVQTCALPIYINTANNFKTSEDTNKCVANFIKGTDLKEHTFNVYNDVTVESGILNFANTINAGLIGIGTHGRKGLAHFFNGSISEDLVNHAQRPGVTFKIEKKVLTAPSLLQSQRKRQEDFVLSRVVLIFFCSTSSVILSFLIIKFARRDNKDFLSLSPSFRILTFKSR